MQITLKKVITQNTGNCFFYISITRKRNTWPCYMWLYSVSQREVLKHQISQQRNWMEIKQELISKHKKVFCEFIDSIDFELLLQNEQ